MLLLGIGSDSVTRQIWYLKPVRHGRKSRCKHSSSTPTLPIGRFLQLTSATITQKLQEHSSSLSGVKRLPAAQPPTRNSLSTSTMWGPRLLCLPVLVPMLVLIIRDMGLVFDSAVKSAKRDHYCAEAHENKIQLPRESKRPKVGAIHKL